MSDSVGGKRKLGEISGKSAASTSKRAARFAAKDAERAWNYGDRRPVDLSRISMDLWMVRIPQRFAEKWREFTATTEVGVFKILNDNGENRISVNLDGEKVEYQLTRYSDPPNMHVLSEDIETGELAMEGTVQHQFNLQPRAVGTAVYKSAARDLWRHAHTHSLSTARHDGLLLTTPNDTEESTTLVNADVIEERRATERRIRNRTETVFREQMPKEELMAKLFDLFEEKDYWPITELLERTQQPRKYLQNVLNEVADYVRAGEHRNTYELKPEYQRDTDRKRKLADQELLQQQQENDQQ